MINKNKLIKWLKEEIYGCHVRREIEREIALTELLTKIKRGFFDKEELDK